MIGHPADPLHPFSDADMLVDELPNARLVDANSILEWRLSPARLNDELAGFLDEVYESRKPVETPIRTGGEGLSIRPTSARSLP